eukprot:18662-Heterococcus_DN1.PRE.2
MLWRAHCSHCQSTTVALSTSAVTGATDISEACALSILRSINCHKAICITCHDILHNSSSADAYFTAASAKARYSSTTALGVYVLTFSVQLNVNIRGHILMHAAAASATVAATTGAP